MLKSKRYQNFYFIETQISCIYYRIYFNQTITFQIGSIAQYSGRRLNVQKVITHPKYYIESKRKERRDALKEMIINWELNDRERTQQFFEKYNEYKKAEESFSLKYTISFLNDIALIKVKNRIIPVFNDSHYIVNGICLPKSQIINERNESLFIIGFGATDPSNSQTHGMKEGMTVMRRQFDECRNSTKNPIKNITRVICTNRLHHMSDPFFNSSTCAGDSGAPQHQLYGCHAVQISLTSFGSGICSMRDGMIRVSENTEWIRSQIFNDRFKRMTRNSQLRVS